MVLAPDEVMDKDLQDIDARQLFKVAVTVIPSNGRAQFFSRRLVNCPSLIGYAMKQADQLAFFKVIGNMAHGSALQCWQITDQAIRPVELDAVLASEAAAPQWALQVFGEVEHHAISSMTTGQDPLVSAVHVIVVPYDHGELISLHGGSFSWLARPVAARVLISG
jgi:hypothetical protein